MSGQTPYYFDYEPIIRNAKIRDFYQRNNSSAKFVCEIQKKNVALKVFPQEKLKCSSHSLETHRLWT